MRLQQEQQQAAAEAAAAAQAEVEAAVYRCPYGPVWEWGCYVTMMRSTLCIRTCSIPPETQNHQSNSEFHFS